MSIRAVIFDIGGVLLRTEDFSHQRWWEQRLGLRKGSFGEVFWNNPVSRRANIGLATRDEVWAAIYARALADLQVAPREAIFVDDIEKNVEAAQAIGMQGIRFESTSQVIDQIDDLLKG